MVLFKLFRNRECSPFSQESGVLPADSFERGEVFCNYLRPFMSDPGRGISLEVEENGKKLYGFSVIKKANGSLVIEDKEASYNKVTRKMDDVYLVMVNPDYNNNKYYKMSDNHDGTWTATYGRVGDDAGPFGKREKTYPAHMWAIKYEEKILKGYQDVSELHKGVHKTVHRKTGEYAEIEDKDVRELIDYLSRCSRQFVKENYTVSAEQVTKEMLEEGRKYLNLLDSIKDLEQFNETLIKLFTAIPRRMGHVNGFLANDKSDFDKIISREKNTFSVMESQVLSIPITAQKVEKEETILDHHNVEVYLATEKEKEDVFKYLSLGMQKKVRRVFRVINKKTQENLNEYKKTHDAEIKMFWHGSRNENWLSLIIRGLVLNANAVVTAKMWGNGIYFADEDIKSWGYTSSRDAKWTRENSRVCYMGLCATAYGKPFFPKDHHEFNPKYSWNDFHRKHPDKDCVHAKKKVCGLHLDEMIFYREDQVSINYIVEFNAV